LRLFPAWSFIFLQILALLNFAPRSRTATSLSDASLRRESEGWQGHGELDGRGVQNRRDWAGRTRTGRFALGADRRGPTCAQTHPITRGTPGTEAHSIKPAGASPDWRFFYLAPVEDACEIYWNACWWRGWPPSADSPLVLLTGRADIWRGRDVIGIQDVEARRSHSIRVNWGITAPPIAEPGRECRTEAVATTVGCVAAIVWGAISFRSWWWCWRCSHGCATARSGSFSGLPGFSSGRWGLRFFSSLRIVVINFASHVHRSLG